MGALTNADVAAVRQVWDDMLEANFAMDWRTWLGHMTNDCVTIDPRLNGPLIGVNATREWIDATDFSEPEGSFTVKDISGDGNLACVVWTFEARWMEGGDRMEGQGKGMSVFRREEGGPWRMSHNAWNMNP